MPEGFYVWRRWGCTSWGIHLINTPLLTGSWLLIVSMETVEHCFQLTLFLKKYYIFHFNFSAGFRVWSSHSSSMNRKRNNVPQPCLASVPAPNLQDVPFSKDLVSRQPEETLVRPELYCPSGGAFRRMWVCTSCPPSSFRARHLSICSDLPSSHGHNHPLKAWLLTSLILRHLSGFCLQDQESIWRFLALAVPVFGTWLPPWWTFTGWSTGLMGRGRESEHSTSIHPSLP